MIPDRPGFYQVKCDQFKDVLVNVRVFKTTSRSGKGVLVVDCPKIGLRRLKDYQDALTNTEWKLIGW